MTSLTVTWKLHVAVLKKKGLTWVVPKLKLPDVFHKPVMVTAPSLSLAVAAGTWTVVEAPIAGTVKSAGHVMVGGVTSLTVTCTVHVAALPPLSVAVHVTWVVPTLNWPEFPQTPVILTAPSLSLAVAAGNGTVVEAPVAFTVNSAGHVMVGGVTALTVTVTVQVADLPAWSVAVQTTGVTPTGYMLLTTLAGGEQPGAMGPSTRSVADAAPRETLVAGPVASTVTSAGHAMEGGVVSTTVTSHFASGATLPAASWAVHLTVVVPTGKPSVGASQDGVTVPSTASVADGFSSTLVREPVASTGLGQGKVMIGATLSRTVTLKVHSAAFFALSAAVHLTTVSPGGKLSPGATTAAEILFAQVGVIEPSTASVAEAGIQVATVSGPVASTVTSAGHVTEGAVVSTTVTSHVAFATLPAATSAVHVTVVLPTGNPLLGRSQVGVIVP